MEPIDIRALVTQIQTAATAVVKQDVTTLQGFPAQQLNDIAQQAVLLSAGIADGSLTEDDQNFFSENIKEMVASFVNTLAGLIVVIVEETLNAIIGVIWAAIGKATGVALAVP